MDVTRRHRIASDQNQGGTGLLRECKADQNEHTETFSFPAKATSRMLTNDKTNLQYLLSLASAKMKESQLHQLFQILWEDRRQ